MVIKKMSARICFMAQDLRKTMVEDSKPFCQVLRDLGESSSLHGVPKIITSRQIAVKLLWCILLLGAIGLSTYQIIGLFKEYYSFPVKTSVSLKYAKLPFPTVTICNINPIRHSQLSENGEINSILQQKLNRSGSTNNQLYNNFLNSNDSDYDYNYTELFKQRDFFQAWRERVLSSFRKLPIETRADMGHQINEMLHQFNFLGFDYMLFDNDTKVIQSPLYGNCYIIQLSESSQTSGPEKGMRIILNIEKEEYIEHFVSGYGMRISVHQPGTFPLPEKDSLLLNPGHETNIGIKMVKISRLGGLYGECTDGDGYQTAGGSAYSVPACHAVCLRDHVREICGCTPYDSPEDGNPYFICNVDDFFETTCVETVSDEIYFGYLNCDCPPRCQEDNYRTTITSRKWPNPTFLDETLLRESCDRNMPSMNKTCARYLSNETTVGDYHDDFASNFLAVNIYFEDLNYETITEEPLYNTIRFLSDLGGAMGLYMGASLLTYVEILQLILEISLFIKARYKSTLKRETEVRPGQIPVKSMY